ncbi:MAG TPA: biotin/lipoyl-containing protein [Polyangiaceae bacterium]
MLKKYFVSAAGREFAVTLDTSHAGGRLRLQIDSDTGTAERVGRLLGNVAEVDGRLLELEAFSDGVQLKTRHHRLECHVSDRPRMAAARGAAEARSRHRVLTAPLPGQVTAVLVEPGERVSAGQRVVLIEAMKMQNPILAERDGTVLQVFVTPGDTVQVAARLVDIGD